MLEDEQGRSEDKQNRMTSLIGRRTSRIGWRTSEGKGGVGGEGRGGRVLNAHRTGNRN